jgi:hypothetical protein
MVTTGGPAFAAAPGNDVFANSTAVSAFPFTSAVDTTKATTDADDTAVNADCGAPATEASVWYAVTPSTNTGLVADVSGSSYDAGVMVATGGPGNWTMVSCGPGATAWSATAGVTYSVIAFDAAPGAGNGGALTINIETTPPPPTIGVTVNPTATFNTKTGSATVSGSVTCSGVAEFAFLDVSLSQSVGRLIVRGYGGTDVVCDGVTRPWTSQVTGDNGTFAGGKALTATFAVACGKYDCGVDFQERTIQLKGGKR